MDDRFTNEKLQSVIERITEESRQRLVYFDVARSGSPSLRVRLAVYPCPREATYPKTRTETLHFFGQFLFDDMPTADIHLPETGLLQKFGF